MSVQLRYRSSLDRLRHLVSQPRQGRHLYSTRCHRGKAPSGAVFSGRCRSSGSPCTGRRSPHEDRASKPSDAPRTPGLCGARALGLFPSGKRVSGALSGPRPRECRPLPSRLNGLPTYPFLPDLHPVDCARVWTHSCRAHTRAIGPGVFKQGCSCWLRCAPQQYTLYCSTLFPLSNSYAAGTHSRQPKELHSGGNVDDNTQHRTTQEGATAWLLDAPNRNNGSDEKGNGAEPHEENSL
jgi:hypothetical protein